MPDPALRLAPAVVVFAASILIAGCSSLERGTEKVVAKSLEAVNEDANRTRVEELLTSEEVREATRELTGVVLDTAVRDLTEDERSDRIREVAARFVHELTPALAKAFDEELWPGAREKLRESVALVLEEVLSEETLERARSFASDTARDVVEATAPDLARTVSSGLSEGLETAFAAILRGEVLPALEDSLGRDHGPAVRSLARHASHGALLGVADAMNGEFGDVFDRERDEIFDRLDDSTRTATWRFKAALAGLGLVVLAGLIVLAWMRRGQRQREEAVELLLGELRRQEGDPLEKARASGRRGADYLEKHLARRGT